MFRYSLLELRFSQLSENHREMIKLKDEYKSQVSAKKAKSFLKFENDVIGQCSKSYNLPFTDSKELSAGESVRECREYGSQGGEEKE